MKTDYKQIYGASLRRLGASLGANYQTVANWHEKGLLREVLATGKKPKRNSFYRRQCGYSLKELAAQRGCSIYKVWGEFQKALHPNIQRQTRGL